MTCPLHDDTAKRNTENVKRAAEEALEAAKNVFALDRTVGGRNAQPGLYE